MGLIPLSERTSEPGSSCGTPQALHHVDEMSGKDTISDMLTVGDMTLCCNHIQLLRSMSRARGYG